MLALTAVALAGSTPDFQAHLEATRPQVQLAEPPSLAERRRRAKLTYAPVIISGFASSGLGVVAIGAGLWVASKGSLVNDDGGALFGGLALALAGGGLAVSGLIVGGIGTFAYDREIRAIDRLERKRSPLRVRPTIGGLSGTF